MSNVEMRQFRSGNPFKKSPQTDLVPDLFRFFSDFKKNPDEIEEIPEVLEKYLDNVARSGDIVFKWEDFKPLIKKKIQMIAAEFNEAHPCDPNLNQPNVKPFEFEEVKRNILNGIDSFTGAPFTIQRICELLTNPYKHYRRADKFLKGLEKNVMVISEETVDQSKTENGNTSASSICLNATFTMPSTSAFHNGFKDSQPDDQILPQQLDSFTSVFVSSSQTSHLERIASLQILEQSTTIGTTLVGQQTSHSQLRAIQPFLATTSTSRLSRISDPALDSLEKITQEIPIVEQQPLGCDIIIETVNSEEPAVLSSVDDGGEKIVLEENKCLESEVGSEKAADDPVVSKRAPVDDAVESSDQLQTERTNLNGDTNAEPQNEQTQTPVKDQGACNELKRVHEDNEIDRAEESFKRFKSDEPFAQEEQTSEETGEQESRDSIDESEHQLDDKKEQLPKIEEQPSESPESTSEHTQTEEKTDQQAEVASEDRPPEPGVSIDENASEPAEQ